MGKKPGDSQRTKGNAQPSSSSKAAEMLQQVAPNLTGFSTSMPPIGIGNLLDDSFDSGIDSELRMALKKLSKKDNLTKLKSLEELKALIETKSNDDCVAIVAYWSKSYTKLTIENDRKIREMSQQVHEKFCSKVTKSIAPYLKQIMPYWILAQSDSHSNASKIAKSSFTSTFNEAKQLEVINFTKDEILNVIYDYLIVETAKTLSDMKTTSQDEAEQKYENILIMSLRGLNLFIRYYFSSGSKLFAKEATSPGGVSGADINKIGKQHEKLEKIFNDSKFWKFSKDNSIKIRTDFYQLICSILDLIVFDQNVNQLGATDESIQTLILNLKSKTIPLIFYACDEENEACASFIWQSIEKCLRNPIDANIWQFFNVKKAFVPKLIALLKNHSNGNANVQNVDTVYSGVSELLRRMGQSSVFSNNELFEEKLGLYRDVMFKLFESVAKETSVKMSRSRQDSIRMRKIATFFDCLADVVNDLIYAKSSNNDDQLKASIEFCSELILNYVIKIYESYLDSNESESNSDRNIGFELKFEQFIENVLDKETSETITEIDTIKSKTWMEMKSILIKKMDEHTNDPLKIQNLLKNFCFLFQSYVHKQQCTSKSKENVNDLIELVFSKTLGELAKDFEQIRNDSSYETNFLNRLQNLNICTKNLISANIMRFFVKILLDQTVDDSVTCLDRFNDDLMEKMMRASVNCSNIEVVLKLVELFVHVNTRLQPHNLDIIIKKLDHYLFDLAKEPTARIESFLKLFLKAMKSKSVDANVVEKITEWISRSFKCHEFVTNKFLNDEANRFEGDGLEIVYEMAESLRTIDTVKNPEKEKTMLKFIDLILTKNRSFLTTTTSSSQPKTIPTTSIASFLKFNLNFISSIQSKYITGEYLWSQLLDILKLRRLMKPTEFKTLEVNFHSFCASLATILLRDHLTKDKSNYDGLISFITSPSNKTAPELVQIVKDLVKLFDQTARKLLNSNEHATWMQNLLIKTLLNTNLTPFNDVFNSILSFKNNEEKNSNDLLVKLYLDERLNFLYTDFHPNLLNKPNGCSKVSNLEALNQLCYTLSLLNIYVKNDSTSASIENLLNESTLISSGNWFYVLASALLVLKFYAARDGGDGGECEKKVVKAIKSEFMGLYGVQQAKFFNHMFEFLNREENSREAFEKIFASDNEKLTIKLNNMSFYLTSLVDLAMVRSVENADLLSGLNQFAQNLITYLIGNRLDETISEEIVKFYLYDLSFAKHSVIVNLGAFEQDIDHYYTLFNGLVESTLGKLSYIGDQLKALNQAASDDENYLSQLAANLAHFNAMLDILTKYMKFYLDLLGRKNNADSNTNCSNELENSVSNKIHEIFNCSPKSHEFISAKLSKHLLTIVELFIDLKESITNSVKKLAKHFGSNFIGGYFFYYSVEFFAKNEDHSVNGGALKWQIFALLDKMNCFLRLLFIDYKFSLRTDYKFATRDSTTTSAVFIQQLSQYLQQKHWDFILCYSAEIAQKLNFFQHFKDHNYLRIMFINFSTMLDLLVKCANYRLRDNRTGTYPQSVHADWNGFFSKEIFDPLLILYVKMSESYLVGERADSSNYTSRLVVEKLGNVVSQISFERLQLNELEPKLNVLDFDMANLGLDVSVKKSSVIFLNDKLKTVLNYLVPNLRHHQASIQLSSYKILRTLMNEMSRFYEIKETETDGDREEVYEGNLEDEEKTKHMSVIESLPHVLRSSLSELTELFGDLKNTIPFDQSILVTDYEEDDGEDEDDVMANFEELYFETNNKLMAYLLVNRLFLDMFATNNLEFKVKLGNDLRDINFNDFLMHVLFRIMSTNTNSLRYFQTAVDFDYELGLDEIDTELARNLTLRRGDFLLTFQNEFVEFYACKLYKYALKCVPAIVRDWWNMQPKRVADQVDKFTTKYVSPVLIEDEIRQVNRSANLISLIENESSKATSMPSATNKNKKYVDDDDEQSTIKIRGMLSTREIVSTYKMKELNMELVIQLPVNYPLGVVRVSSLKRLGVSENEWRNWLLQLTTFLIHQNGSICQGLQIWKRNVDKKFAGVEECTICYSVIHGTNFQLPKMKCRTCKKLFHSICLYKWFESSSKSTCPLCRNIF